MNTLPTGKRCLDGETTYSRGGAGNGASAKAAPAQPQYVVGEIGFGPCWEEEPSLRELYDQACASIVRAECEIEELRAEVALLKAGMLLLAQERDKAKATIEGLRDAACAEKCRDKAAADGGWANI